MIKSEAMQLLSKALNSADKASIESALGQISGFMDDSMFKKRTQFVMLMLIERGVYTGQEITQLCTDLFPDLLEDIDDITVPQVTIHPQQGANYVAPTPVEAQQQYDQMCCDPEKIREMNGILESFARGGISNHDHVFNMVSHFKNNIEVRAKFQQALLIAVSNSVLTASKATDLINKYLPNLDQNEDLSEFETEKITPDMYFKINE
jgi:hypothetical protein